LSDETYDEMIEKAAAMGDKPEERWEILQEAERYLIENALVIPTYQSGSAVLTKDYIEGAIDQVNGIKFYVRYAQVYEERSEEHTSELQSRFDLVCRLLLEKKKKKKRLNIIGCNSKVRYRNSLMLYM